MQILSAFRDKIKSRGSQVEITGLDITLQRITAIEQQFQRLTNETEKPDKDFQSILDSSMRINSGEEVLGKLKISVKRNLIFSR